MQLQSEATSLVIIGAWNPAILSPEWLVKEVYKKPEGEQLPVTMEFASIPGMPPRFTIMDTRFIPNIDKLVISPHVFSKEALASIEEKAITILETLPHTPIAGFGENIGFTETNPTPEQLQLFRLNDNLAERFHITVENVSTTIKTSLKLNGCILNLSHQFSNGELKINFNFHYEVKSAREAVEKLRDTYVNNLNTAIDFMKSYEGVPADLEEVISAQNR